MVCSTKYGNKKTPLLLFILCLATISNGQNWVSYPIAGIVSIAVDRNEIVWAGNSIGTISKFDRERWINVDTWSDIQRSRNLGHILGVWDISDTLYIGTDFEGLWAFDKGAGIRHFHESSTGNGIIGCVKDSSGSLWILDKFGRFSKWNGSEWEDILTFIDQASFLAIDEDDNFWIGSNNVGLIRYSDGETFEFNTTFDSLREDYIPSTRLTSIDFDQDGNIWLGSRNRGLLKFNQSKWMHFDTTNSAIPSNHVISLAIDKNNVKWIGTFDSGVTRFNDESWITYNTQNSELLSNLVNDITVDSTGRKWIATDFNEFRSPSGGQRISAFQDVITNFDYSVGPDGNISFQDLSISLNGSIVEWHWSIEGVGEFSNIQNPTYNIEETGAPEVTLSVIDEKRGFGFFSREVEVEIVTSLERENLDLFIFPNPTQDFLRVMNAKEYSIEEINLFDFQGREIGINFENYSIDVSTLPSGIYFIKIENSENAFIKRFVKL